METENGKHFHYTLNGDNDFHFHYAHIEVAQASQMVKITIKRLFKNSSNDRLLGQVPTPQPVTEAPATAAVPSSSLVLQPHTIPGTFLKGFTILAVICYFISSVHPPPTPHLASCPTALSWVPCPGKPSLATQTEFSLPGSPLSCACTTFVPGTTLLLFTCLSHESFEDQVLNHPCLLSIQHSPG